MVSINVYTSPEEARDDPKLQFQIPSMSLPITSRYHVLLRRGKFHRNKGSLGQNIPAGRVFLNGYTNVTDIKVKRTIHSQGHQTGTFFLVLFGHDLICAHSNQVGGYMSMGTAWTINRDNCVSITWSI